MRKRFPSFRRLFHGLATLCFAVLTIARPLPPFWNSLWLRLSPVLALGTLAARRWVGATLWLTFPIVGLALWRRRWFCFHLCPTGFCLETVGRLHPRAAGKFAGAPRIGLLVLGLLAGSALVGFPLLLGLDPLAIFSAFFGALHRPNIGFSLLPAGGLLLLIALSIWRPHLWCLRLCPLGALQDLLHETRRTLTSRQLESPPDGAHVALSRRTFLALLAGALTGTLFRRLIPSSAKVRPLPIRPPGAAQEPFFQALCARCGACIQACPSSILIPDCHTPCPGSLGTPIVHYIREGGFCRPDCRACTLTCPAGAIRPLSLEAKQRLSIGEARVARSLCLAWRDGAWCMQCAGACPYEAIEEIESGGVPCPIVRTDRCRGCGACRTVCPAEPDPAITVLGIPQKQVQTALEEEGGGTGISAGSQTARIMPL